MFPILAALPIIGKVFEQVFGIIDKAVEDKDKANELKAQITQQVNSIDAQKFVTEIQMQAGVIMSETQGESWLQRNWRPVLMLTCIFIVANNFIFYPYLQLFGVPAKELLLPDKLWNLMTLGVSGYVVGRSVEKGIDSWKNGSK